MPKTLLDPVAGTGFYVPAAPAADGPMLFLRWTGAGTVPISLDEAWNGTAEAGYFLFLSQMPAASSLAAAETALRARLAAPPEKSSLAWVTIDPAGTPGSVDLLPLGAGDGDVRLVQADFAAARFPDFPSVPIPAGTQVRAAIDGDGFVQGVTTFYPGLTPFGGQQAAGPAWGGGISVPLSGPCTGCLQFQGLRNHGAPSAGTLQKDIFTLSLDPLNPFDQSRTYAVATGLYVLLTSQGAGGPFQIKGMPLA